jgi:hypothetical protein
MAKVRKQTRNRLCKVSTRSAFRRVFAELERRGFLLVSDAALPSIGKLVARSPLRGSWWAHPQAQEIFDLANQLEDHPDVLAARLLNRKSTFVHRRLWAALLAIGRSRESWQLNHLPAGALELLARVEKRGVLGADVLASEEGLSERNVGEAARELEERLLTYSESHHTERGAHSKQLESWKHLARRLHVSSPRLSPTQGKAQFEAIAAELANEFGRRVRLPWTYR